MLTKKREYILYSFYDRTGIERHLEQMAARGWMLEKMGRSFWTYRRIEPRAMHFSIVYFAPASEFDCAPGEEQQTFQDYCAAAGWTLAASWSQMLIFASDAESPTPIETDAAVQVEAVHQAMKKNFLLSYGLLLALALFQFVRNLSDLWHHLTDTLANPGALDALLLWFTIILLCATEIASYLLWRRKALRAADEEGRFTPTRGHRRLRLTYELLTTVSLLCLFFSFSTQISFIFAGAFVLIVALQGLLAGLRHLLRRTGWSTEVNRPVTQVLSFLVAFTVIEGVYWGVFRLIRDTPWRETYTWQGDKYDVDPIDLPLTLEDAKAVTQKSALRADRDGDNFYDLLSALQKSIRGSDPDAACHYLARLLEAGQLQAACRRLMVIAAEDVGLAYPMIIPIVKSCVDMALMLGMPEARIPLGDAAVLMATSPKSNSGHVALDTALADVQKGMGRGFPRQLQNVHADTYTQERDQGYLYPHDYPNHWVRQQYLPDDLIGRQYYTFGPNKVEQAAKQYWDAVKKE